MNALKEKIKKMLPDRVYLKIRYKHLTGEKLNLKNPETFNEKLQWLKLNDRNPLYTTFVDKYSVKKYVETNIGKEYVIPILGVWNHFDEINFENLPKRFVLKCTHDSGGVIICNDKNKFDKEKARAILEASLKHNFYYMAREWPYKNVKPLLMAEQYLEDEDAQLKDYKIFCFDGVPYVIEVDFDRFSEHKRNFYTTEWKYRDVAVQYPNCPQRKIERPLCLNEMLKIAAKLSEGIPHVRIDFYVIGEKVYFGEITFYHGGGYEKFLPESFGKELGDMIKLSKGAKG